MPQINKRKKHVSSRKSDESLTVKEKKVKPKVPNKEVKSKADVTRKKDPKPNKSCCALIYGCVLKSTLAILIAVYAVIPFLLHVVPELHRELVFLGRIKWPFFVEYDKPENYGLVGSRNFYLKSTDETTLGVWHVLPKGLAPLADHYQAQDFEASLALGNPIVIYCHGNSGTRATPHRVELYQLFAQSNFHLVTFDYRGYADSTGYASAPHVFEDAETVYTWVRQWSKDSPVYIWGHSLGSAVATALSRKLCRKDQCPVGLILESAFNNFHDEAYMHPMSLPYKYLPGNVFEDYMLPAFDETSRHLISDVNINMVTCRILVLHAEDDFVVPFILGKRLAMDAIESRRGKPGMGEVEFVAFAADRGLGHRQIHAAAELPAKLRAFIK